NVRSERLETRKEESGARGDRAQQSMVVKQLDGALDKGRVDVVLRPRVGLLELLLGGKARRAERWVHQHHVETRAQEVDQRHALRRIARKKPPPHAGTASRSFSELPQRL